MKVAHLLPFALTVLTCDNFPLLLDWHQSVVGQLLAHLFMAVICLRWAFRNANALRTACCTEPPYIVCFTWLCVFLHWIILTFALFLGFPMLHKQNQLARPDRASQSSWWLASLSHRKCEVLLSHITMIAFWPRMIWDCTTSTVAGTQHTTAESSHSRPMIEKSGTTGCATGAGAPLQFS